jgi:hypothetical protein
MSTRTEGRESAARSRGTILVALGVGAALALAGVACATSDAAVTSTEDGGTKLTGEAGPQDEVDASAEDAAPDSLPPPRECSDQNFCHTNIPEGVTLTSVWGDGAGVVWSVSAQGTIYRWDGSQWKVHQQVAADAGAAVLTTVWGSGPTDVWVAGSTGLLHGTGGSAATLSFAPVTGLPGNPDIPLSSIWGSGADNVWAVGYAQDPSSHALSGRVLHFTGASAGWSEVSITVPRENEWDPDPAVAPLGVFGSASSGTWVHGAWIDNQGNAVAVLFHIAPGSSDGVRMKIPEGSDYPPHLEPFTGVGVMDDGTVWLGVVSKTGRHSYIRGKAPYSEQDWESLYRAQYESDPHFFWGASASDSWQVGDFGRLRHWDGTKWTQAIIMVTSAPVKSDFFGAWAANKDDFWVVGDGIALHKKP